MNIMESNIIQIGAQNSAEYSAFGDDCQIGNTLVYAFIIIKSDDIPTVEHRIAKLKEFYGIPPHIALHCRMLFSGDARRKAGINDLSKDKLHSIIRRIVKIINQTPISLRYAYCNLSTLENHFKENNNEIELRDRESKTIMKTSITPTPKGLLGLLGHMSLSAPSENKLIPSIEQCKIIVSEDKSKTRFIGKHERQAHNWMKGFSDINAPKNKVFQFYPVIKKLSDAPMLQIADVAAYMCGQAINKSDRYNFTTQLKQIRLWTSTEFVIAT